MGYFLTERMSIALGKETMEELHNISDFIKDINTGDDPPIKSELIRYAVYTFIDKFSNVDKSKISQSDLIELINIKSNTKKKDRELYDNTSR